MYAGRYEPSLLFAQMRLLLPQRDLLKSPPFPGGFRCHLHHQLAFPVLLPQFLDFLVYSIVLSVTASAPHYVHHGGFMGSNF